MDVRLITYDLNKESNSEGYKEVLKIIKSYNYAKLSESSYAIETTDQPTAIYNKLKPHIDNNDYLLVITLNKPYYGRNHKDVIAWLDSKL